MRLLSLDGYLEFRRLRRNYRLLGITHEQTIVHASEGQIQERALYFYERGWVMAFSYESGLATVLMLKERASR